MLSKFRKFLASESQPLWLVVINSALALIISISVSLWFDTRNRRENVVVEDIRAFEAETSEFNVLFGSFAYEIINGRDVSLERKDAIFKNISKQYFQLQNIYYYVDVGDKPSIKAYSDRLDSVRRSIENTQNFGDLKPAYEDVDKLLNDQEHVLNVLRTRKGMDG